MSRLYSSQFFLPILLLVLLLTAAIGCALLGAIPFTVMLLVQNDPDTLLAAPAFLLLFGVLGFVLAIPALLVTIVLYLVDRRPIAATEPADAGTAQAPPASKLPIVMAAFAALLGSICCGLTVPFIAFVAMEGEIRTESELGDALGWSIVAFLVASVIGALLAGVLAWLAARRYRGSAVRETS